MSSKYIANTPSVHATQSFTRPADATAYTGSTSSTTGDLVANSTTAGSVAALEFLFPPIKPASRETGGMISYVRISKSGPASATYRAHFYKTTAPTVSAGDNSAIAVSNHDSDKYLGFADVVMTPSPSGGAAGVNDSVRIPYTLSVTAAGVPQTIYVLLENLVSYTPSSASVHKVVLGVVRDV